MNVLVLRWLLFLGVFFLVSCEKQSSDDSIFDIGGFYVANHLVGAKGEWAFLEYTLLPNAENANDSMVHVLVYISDTNLEIKISDRGNLTGLHMQAALEQTGLRRFVLKPHKSHSADMVKRIEAGNVEIEQIDRSTIKFSLTINENGKDVKVDGFLTRVYPTTEELLLRN